MVGFLGTLDEGVEFDEGVGAARGRQIGGGIVGGCELGGEVGEVGKG